MKKIIIPLILILALAGCSSGAGTADRVTAPAAAADGYSNSMGGVEYVVTEAATTEKYLETNDLPSSEDTAESEKMIIRNAELSIETLNIDDTYNKLTAKLYELGGSIHNEESYKNDIRASAIATFKLPPENLDAFLAYADECGNVRRKIITSEDITAQYIDTEIRLENKRRNLEKYYEYLDDATRSEDVIAIQNEIDRITADIETYQGMLNYWNRSVAESQVVVSIEQLQDPNEIDIEDVEFSTLSLENMGKIMVNGVKKCADVIVTIFQWLIIVIVTLSPVLLLVAVVVTIIILIAKRKKRVKKQQIEAEKPDGNTFDKTV
jgi:uncharacterized protein YceK